MQQLWCLEHHDDTSLAAADAGEREQPYRACTADESHRSIQRECSVWRTAHATHMPQRAAPKCWQLKQVVRAHVHVCAQQSRELNTHKTNILADDLLTLRPGYQAC